jgi:hypothetical protein
MRKVVQISRVGPHTPLSISPAKTLCMCGLLGLGVGVKLDKEDLDRVADLWDNVINPTCVKWGQETGKPAEAYREAVVGLFERQASKLNSWNAWQRIWWHGMSDVEDETLVGMLVS